MKLYNTLTRQKEEFVPITPGEVKMYSCGPTVYNYFHVGNARPFIIFDLLRCYLEYRGYKVKFVQNFTDIDDKVINKANEEGVDFNTIAERYIKEYYVDAQGLGVKKASVHPRATETMDAIIDIVERLIENGHAYVAENGDVYFRTKSFPEYGKLCHQPMEELQAGARISVGEVAVFAVTQQRMPQQAHMRADLVGAAGVKRNAVQADLSGIAQQMHACADGLVALAARPVGAGPSGKLYGFGVRSVKMPCFINTVRAAAEGQTKVGFGNAVLPDQPVDTAQRGSIFGSNDQPLCAAVQPVAYRRGKGVLCGRVIVALFGQVARNALDKAGVAGIVRMAEYPCRLVHDKQVFILKYDLKRNLSQNRRLFLRNIFKKFIHNVQVDFVTGLQTIIRLGFFPVDLDAAVAEAFVQQRAGQAVRDAFHKAGKPHLNIVGADGKAFHNKPLPTQKIHPAAIANKARLVYNNYYLSL